MLELVKWCFKDANSGFATIVVLVVVFGGIVKIIKSIKGSD